MFNSDRFYANPSLKSCGRNNNNYGDMTVLCGATGLVYGNVEPIDQFNYPWFHHAAEFTLQSQVRSLKNHCVALGYTRVYQLYLDFIYSPLRVCDLHADHNFAFNMNGIGFIQYIYICH